ncbi:thioredoxin family protein [uncultured Winogradskyella sp.]|uniref:thioredoxin family protein n=1 Tax=uncultured Winogradskyella sp. TaxID=395353 RepID=UPI0026183D40|nr:thioredoxin family protein [uncultured Winogradskyella sp.]|tara:strand:- start:4383 stop:4820 length:438 start_codon:yes stop_codon:yes gene_type:complete
MKTKLLFIIFLFLSIQAYSQDWQTDFETSKELASDGDKIIVLVFQGSDWCAPCIKLDREVWSTQEFQDLAEDKFVMLQADFPRRKNNKLTTEQQEHNNALAEKYNKNGYFPFVVILDSDGNELGSLGYEKTTPTKYFEKIVSFED